MRAIPGRLTTNGGRLATNRTGKRAFPLSSVRFLREMTISVLASVVASLMFSHLSHEPVPKVPPAATGKLDDRMSWAMEEVPTRDTMIYDTVAMFALPLVTERAWSEPAAMRPGSDMTAELALAKPARPAIPPLRVAAAEIEAPRRPAAMVPPSRPAVLASAAVAPAVFAPAVLAPAVLAEAEPAPQPVRVFGWAVPGSDLLASGGRHAFERVASLGGRVASLGDAVVESVGIR